MSKKLVIFGASGGVGKHLVAQALSQGHSVRAVVRKGSAPPEWKGRERLEVIEGDVLDPAFVAQAVRGQERVLHALGLKRVSAANPWSKLVSPEDFASRTARHIVQAMEAEGVSRFVGVSAAGVAETYPKLNGLMKFFLATSKIGIAYRDLERMEEVLRASKLDWIACRPTRLMDTGLTRQVSVIEDGHFPLSAQISRADVAWWMLEHLEKPSSSRTPTITSRK